jgi:hypothetical protein
MSKPLIRRQRAPDGAWDYGEHAEAVVDLIFFYDFDLVKFDNWLEAYAAVRWPPEQVDNLLVVREHLLRAVKEDDERAVCFGVRYFGLLKLFKPLEDELLPLAAIGKRVRGRLPEPGSSKSVYLPTRDRDEIVARDRRILKATCDGKSVAAIAKAERVSASTVARVRRRHGI